VRRRFRRVATATKIARLTTSETVGAIVDAFVNAGVIHPVPGESPQDFAGLFDLDGGVRRKA
jgi:hypothetical protein